MKKMLLIMLALTALTATTSALAAISGIGSVATNVVGNFAAIAKLITAASYVAGMAFAIGAIVKFKAHKDNPTQVPISQGVVLLFVAAALIFIPTIYSVSGKTLFAGSGQVGGISGVTSFGASTSPDKG